MLRRLLFRLRMAWYAMWFALEDLAPKPCAQCQRWVLMRTMRRAKHVVAGWVDVCEACYADLYGHDDAPHL